MLAPRRPCALRGVRAPSSGGVAEPERGREEAGEEAVRYEAERRRRVGEVLRSCAACWPSRGVVALVPGASG